MRPHKAPPRAALTVLFALVVFCVLSITMLIIGAVSFLLVRLGVIHAISTPNILLPQILTFAIASILMGTAVAAVVGRVPLKPVNRLIEGMNRLAAGDYEVRIDMGHHPVGHELAETFNLLAKELKNTEVLRADFVNNFSHEFKTPIVSIRGFAKLLQKEGLTDAQRAEYLGIIVDESNRLADMATNVLNLTKVENQSILVDITHYNLSEQLRDAVLLLEKKWGNKGLTIVADFDEYGVDASEELLKQVWINLLDNAVKFSPERGEISIAIRQSHAETVVSITNAGPQINEEDQQRVFSKFWQGDTSHAAEGTGIGLSIARRIVTLHKGTISVTSMPPKTTFSVALPNE